MKFHLVLLSFLITSLSFSQEPTFVEQELSINKNIDGILLTPKTEKPTLAIILSGSGPNDRDGNSNMVKGNMVKKLAEQLSNNGIATYRYDKRSSKYIKERNPAVHNLTFDVFIDDAKACLEYFKDKNIFSKIYVIGHSQGSLVGMVAARERADGFISIAGPGLTIDATITDQITQSAPMFTEDAKRIFGLLKNGETTDDFPVALASVFNKGVQPFIMNWMQYDPQDEIKKLDVPILIINGTNDIQINESDANLLHIAAPESELVIIENMNHALVIYENKDRLGNMKSYNETSRELSQELIDVLIEFIK